MAQNITKLSVSLPKEVLAWVARCGIKDVLVQSVIIVAEEARSSFMVNFTPANFSSSRFMRLKWFIE